MHPPVVILYESMFGNTRSVAEAIAAGFGAHAATTLLRVADAPTAFPADTLLIVGAPTHVHGLSSPKTRDQAFAWSNDPERRVRLEPGVVGRGVREWLADIRGLAGSFATFDTRADIARVLSGSAAVDIDRALRRAGGHRLAEPASFLEHDNSLLKGEVSRARAWGESLARAETLASTHLSG